MQLSLGNASVRIGELVWSSLPPSVMSQRGALICHGAMLNIVDFPELFGVIGARYGGDGVTTFQLPDYRGGALRVSDEGRGLDAGRVHDSYQADIFKAHQHTYRAPYQKYPSTKAASTYPGRIDQYYTDQNKVSTSAGGVETRMKNFSSHLYMWYA